MSKWIRPKYYEQCNDNTHSLTTSVFIDRRKVSKDFWTDLFRDKCPNGLGKISESLKNDDDLTTDDFLDDIDDDELFNINTSRLGDVPQSTSVHQPSNKVLVEENLTAKQDIVNEVDNEQGFSHLEQGFKTPVLHKQKSSSSVVSTPCLFSPDLLSQPSQDAGCTPKTHHVADCTPDDKLLLGSQRGITATPHSLEKGDFSNILQKSPDILDQMIAEKRPRSSLAFLSETDPDEDVDGWSDSMATPPMHWSPSQDGSIENDTEEEEKQEKNVARTLFKGIKKDLSLSPEMSGFSVLDSCEGKHEKSHEEDLEKGGKTNNLCRTFDLASLSKDESSSQKLQDLSGKFKDMKDGDFQQGMKDKQNISNKSDGPDNNMTLEDSEMKNDLQCYNPSLNETIAMFPPTLRCSSPFSYSQEASHLLELVQSTPKVPASKNIENQTPVNRVESRCKIKVKRNNSKSHLQKRSGSGSMSTKRTFSNEIKEVRKMNTRPKERECMKNTNETNAFIGDFKNAKSLEVTSESLEVNCESVGKPSCKSLEKSLCKSLEKSPCKSLAKSPESPAHLQQSVSNTSWVDVQPNVGSLSDITFGSLSKSLEEAMAKEAEVASDARHNTVPDQIKNGNVKKPKEEKKENQSEIPRLPPDSSSSVVSIDYEPRTDSNGAENVKNQEVSKTPLDNVAGTNLGKIEATLSKSTTEIVIKEKSPPQGLSVKRSSRNKRFSYPSVKQPSSDQQCRNNKLDNIGKEDQDRNLVNPVLNEGNGKKEIVKNGKCFRHGTHPNQTQANACSENVTPEQIVDQKLENNSDIEVEPVRDSSHAYNENAEAVGFSSELDDVDNDAIVEDVTDNTLLLLQENRNTPNKSSGEVLFDMDALSQFPYEVLSSTPTAKIRNNRNQQGRAIGVIYKNLTPNETQSELNHGIKNELEPTSFKTYSMSGFKTASGKDVNISEEALQKAKAMFEMENKEVEAKTKTSKHCTMSGFQTASGKDVDISEEAMHKAKAMFEMEHKEDEAKPKTSKHCTMSGFKTASGKDVDISGESLQKAKAMFEMENKEVEAKPKTSKHCSMSGFKTAGGKDVNISEESLQKAKAMFEMENKEVEAKTSKHCTMSGFKTASGKDVDISEEALQKAKAMFEMENKEVEAKTSKHCTMSGFKTASGKDVDISEEALQKAKAMFEMENKEVGAKPKTSKHCTMSGFKTASGKDVDISGESLQKAKAMFEMENKEVEAKPKTSKHCSMSGFKTAGGKDVNISEESLQKAKAMFEMENKEVEAKTSKHCTMSGFKTASGKDVDISEEALQKAKAMFEMENKEVEAKTSKHCTMSGFKTASGKDVDISEEALQKAKAMFEMENKEVGAKPKTSKHCTMSGFKTASGKDVNISEESLQKAKAMFEMENKEVEPKTSKHCTMSGFKTASGKDVNISEEALQKAKAMFEMENKEVEAKTSKHCTMSGFKTASGKDVNISEEALQKAKAMFEMENKEVEAKTSKHCTMSGFKTASGKDVNISEEALQKAKAMFEMENKEVEAKTSKHCTMSGFKTASGKDVNISEEALQKAKAMFEMENKEVEAKTSKHCTMSGFKTASGKDVNISEEALQKAKAMFEMENKEVEAKTSKHCTMSGFKTAGGKDVNISEESLQKAKAMFEMENKEVEAKAKTSKHCTMSGFKTASGKDVDISKEALQKVKVIFEMENKEVEAKPKTSKHCTMSGFKTASGKDVDISKEALQKVKVIFEMENKEVEAKAKTSKHCTMSGFKTAGGKDVDISEQALQKAKAMFEMENKEVEPKTSKHCSMSGFKTASGKDVNISEEALQKAKAMFETESLDTARVLPEVKPSPKPNLDVVNNNTQKHLERSAYQHNHFHSNHVGIPVARDSHVEQKVPTSNNTITSHASCTITSSHQSPLVSQRTSTITTTPITSVDDNLSREILESSAALLADESFTDFTEYLGMHDEGTTAGRSTTLERGKPVPHGNSRNPYHSEPQRSQREMMMSNARQRYKSFLSGDERNTTSTLESRSTLKPVKSSPSNVMFDRRSRTSQPSLRPVVVGPNMSTPLSRSYSAKREERQLFGRQGGALNPRVSSPSPQSPLVTNKQNDTQKIPTSTPTGGPSKKQFTTPYRAQSSAEVRHKETGSGSPERKRPRLNGPVDHAKNPGNRDGVKPKMGYLYDLRQSTKRVSFRQYVNNTLPQSYTTQQLQGLGVCNDVMAITCSNAESFRFAASNFFSEESCTSNQGIRMEDGGLLHIGQDGFIGLEEIERTMLVMPGVDTKLVPHGWIANHYRWIVWKLASMEMAFPHHFAAKCLTPDWVLCQLKYRYDREIDRSHRSALKKILERDDLSSRTMVLCVSSVTPTKHEETPPSQSKGVEDAKEQHDNNAKTPQASREAVGTVIEMTDCWYSIRVALDAPLTDLLSKDKILVGVKLCINGAELTGSDQAVSPLEASSSSLLRISANSTRRARWDSRLGFQTHSHPFPLPLSSLYPNGGVIGCVDVVVLRQYPVEYMERMASGTAVFRNSRAEEREAKKFASTLERAREAVLAKVQKEFEEASNKPKTGGPKKPRRSYSPKDITKIRSGKELYELFMLASDPSFIEECLDNNQRSSLEDYRRLMQDSNRAKLEKMFQRTWEEDEKNISKRTVVPMLKVRLVNYLNSEQDKTEAILTVWRPSEDILQLLSEGSRLRIYHLMASGSRYRQGLPSLQLSTTRSTRYKTMDLDQNTIDDLFSTRQAIPFEELQTGLFALYSEIDLVGCIVYINSHNNSSLQTVYLTDQDNNLIAVKFWGGLKVYAVDDLVRPRCLIACTNLVVRSNEHVNCPTLAFNELSTLTLKPRDPYSRTAMEYLRENIQDLDLLMSNAQRLLDQMRRRPEPAPKMNTSRDCGSPTNQVFSKDLESSKYSTISSESKLAHRGPTLDCIQDTNTIRSRSMSGQCKRKLLEYIPEPTASPSINITSTDSVRRDFKRPRRVTTGSPV